MKVVVLGASGMLGHKMLQTLSKKFDVCGTVRKHNESLILKPYDLYENVDATDFSTVTSALDDIEPDVIVNCVGIVKQLPESNDWGISHAINSEFPRKLCMYSNNNDIYLIHVSTDCVFDGKSKLYKETDIPNATDIYGRTKFMGEISDKKCLTLRTSIIGREINTSHGLLEWFLSKRKDSTKLMGYTKSIFSGVTTNELSHLVYDIVRNKNKIRGLYHVASTPISKYDLLVLINNYLGNIVEIEPVDGEIVNRTLNALKLKRNFGYVPPSWNEMINTMIVKDTTYYGRTYDV